MVGNKDTCYICGSYINLQCHHMLHGTRRKMADKYNLVCMLCVNCHTQLHDKGVYDRELEMIAQKTFEAAHGHDAFMKIFGKNYLEE